MINTGKKYEFYAPRRYEKQSRWHVRNVFVNDVGKEFVRFNNEIVSIEALENEYGKGKYV